jgi:ADP-heptose:LPS heptosyltransferase
MKILFVLFKTLGDVCMGTTVVHAIKQKFPDATIDFATAPQNKNILEGNPDINQIIALDNYYDANLYFIENGYDEIYRVGMANLMDTCWHHIPSQQNQHLVEWYAKRAEIDVLEDKNIYIYLSKDDVEAVDDYWEDLDPNKKYVAFHTTSGHHPGQPPIESKDWPMEKFQAVADSLASSGYGIIQVGAFSDKKLKPGTAIDFTGKFSFKQNAEVIKRCAGYIGVDSGPAYLAGWTGKPTILLMGSTQNIKGRPSVGPRNENVFYFNAPKPNQPACSPVPCYITCVINKPGGCISDIASQQVVQQFHKMVNK